MLAATDPVLALCCLVRPRHKGQAKLGLLLTTMPQLLPFYFVNQLSFAVVVLGTLVYVFGTYVLPVFVQLFVSRLYVTKL
jgi:F-type H+-transporting ATPase subunit 8